MLASILITGGNSQKRKEKALSLSADFLDQEPQKNPDFYLIEDEQSIKIAQIRQLKEKIFLKPFSSPNVVFLLNQAEKMTFPAQNSLLKILEEPPQSAKIILTAPSPKSLLPTIVSRCQQIRLRETDYQPEAKIFENHFLFLQELAGSSPGQRILLAEKYSQDKETIVDFCQNQIMTLRKIMSQEITGKSDKVFLGLKTEQITKIIRSLQKALFLLKSNLNPKMLLENLLISYPI